MSAVYISIKDAIKRARTTRPPTTPPIRYRMDGDLRVYDVLYDSLGAVEDNVEVVPVNKLVVPVGDGPQLEL